MDGLHTPQEVHVLPGDFEWLDYEITMRGRYKNQELKRNPVLEEEALAKTVICKAFSARIRLEVCILRKKTAGAPYKRCVECRQYGG